MRFNTINKLKVAENNKLLLPILLISLPLGVIAILYFATDVVRCRDCAFNSNGIVIKNSEIQAVVRAKETFYSFNNQKVDKDTLSRDVLEELKLNKTIENYAKSKDITVSDEELNTIYQERVKQNTNEEALLKRINDLYGFGKAQYLEVLKIDILRSKVESSLGKPLDSLLNK